LPKHKVTVITGDSATGKSEFYRLVSRFNHSSSFCKYYNEDGSPTCPIMTIERYFSISVDNDKNIIVIDEDSEFLDKNNISKTINLIKTSKNYFLIILRDMKKLSDLSIPISNINSIKHSKNLNVIEPYFPKHIYSSYKNKPIINYIICEDSKSSLLFFRDYYNFSYDNNLFTSKGKDNLSKKLQHKISAGLDNILIVLDACALGLRIYELFKTIKDYPSKKIYILDWRSYEYYLVKSRNIKDIAIQQTLIYNEEKFYEDELKKHLLLYTKSGTYNKNKKTQNDLPICLNLDKRCISIDCSYFNKCISKVDDNFSYDRKKVYIHNPLDKFDIKPLTF